MRISYTKKKSKTKYIGFLIFFSLFIAKCRCAPHNTTIRAHIPRIRIPRYITNACKHRIQLCAEHYYYFELYTIFTYPSRPITPPIWFVTTSTVTAPSVLQYNILYYYTDRRGVITVVCTAKDEVM